MSLLRRRLLKGLLLLPILAGRQPALAVDKPGPGTLRSAEAVLRVLGIGAWQASGELALNVADVAENGALVAVEASSTLPDVRRLVLVAERNPYPLIADFRFEPGAWPSLEARIKLAESSHVAVYAQTAERWLQTRKFVRVIAGGCG